MGYLTKFTIKIVTGEDPEGPSSDKILSELRGSCDALYAVDVMGHSSDSVKWYTMNDDMIKFSKCYPQIVFVVTGDGEEGDHFYRSYFLGGQSYSKKGAISYPPFDATKLK